VWNLTQEWVELQMGFRVGEIVISLMILPGDVPDLLKVGGTWDGLLSE
jgi:hypothetical protein